MPIIDANGEKLAYVDEGDGPALLLIHSLGANGTMWREQIAALRERYRCIAFDCRGHGDSSYNSVFSVPEVAADHKAGLDALGVETCHILGLSMGGMIALDINARWPQMTRSLIIADSFARPRDGAEDRIYATQEAVAYLSMKEFGNQYAGDRLMPTTPMERIDELTDAVAKVPPKAYVDTVRAIFTVDYTDALGKVDAPTLVLIGDQDDATPLPESEYMVERIKDAEFGTIAGAGHLSNIDQPEAFNAAIAEFLDRQAR